MSNLPHWKKVIGKIYQQISRILTDLLKVLLMVFEKIFFQEREKKLVSLSPWKPYLLRTTGFTSNLPANF